MTIREFIRDDLSSRIGREGGPPMPLTLEAIARHYGVSPTPVRQAIGDLLSEGVLLRQGNGRIRINPRRGHRPRGVKPGPGPEWPGRSEGLEAALSAEVIARSLRGESDYLREEVTADRFGVGRTAIRQVLGRLAGRGLIVHVPRCGWRVRPFVESDLRDYLEVRETLELKALDLARPHLAEGDLRRMLEGNAPADGPPRLDNTLHAYLVEKSGNAYIRDFFDRHGAYFTTLLDYAAPEARVLAEMAGQHGAILRALIDRDWPRARRALARHIRAQIPIVRSLMRRIGPLAPDEDRLR